MAERFGNDDSGNDDSGDGNGEGPVYSEKVEQYLQRRHRKTVFRNWRVLFLSGILAIVAIWGGLTYLEDHQTFAWDETVTVGVVGLLDDGGEASQQDEWFAKKFLSRAAAAHGNLLEVENWLQKEYTRHTGDDRAVFDISVRGPVRLETPPPSLPGPEASFFARYRATQKFLGYFHDLTQRQDLLFGRYDVTVFIYFYDYRDLKRRKVFSTFDSVASRRDRLGIVFAPITNKLVGNTCAIVAHEICHTLGASDKYDGNQSVFPEGYAEPDRKPLFPQRKAEIMSLGIPTSPGKDQSVRSLRQCVVGDVTAQEMNWQRE